MRTQTYSRAAGSDRPIALRAAMQYGREDMDGLFAEILKIEGIERLSGRSLF